MSSSNNGRHGNSRDPTRQLRYDDLASIMAQTYARSKGGDRLGMAMSPRLPRFHSGRRLVIAAGLAVLLIWGVLFLVFSEWRARYRERAAYGATQVVPAIDPIADIVPPGVDPAAWRDAVRGTHDMLLTVTSSNLLGIAEMGALRAELDQAVSRARAHPETAVSELASVWYEIAERGEFFFRDSRSPSGARHPRPKLLPSYGEARVVSALRPLAQFIPPRVDPADWRDALSQTGTMLLTVTDSNQLSMTQMKALRSYLDQVVARAVAHPESAVDELANVWDSVADRYRSLLNVSRSATKDGIVRPKLLPSRP